MMNREFKFRFFHKEYKHWSEFPQKHRLEDINSYPDYEVNEYTGLLDINGEEIYEGDIVEGKDWSNGEEYGFVGVVKYLSPSFKVIGTKDSSGLHYELNRLCKVVGNIYEGEIYK